MMDSNIYQIGEFYISCDESRNYYTDISDLNKRTLLSKGEIFFCCGKTSATLGTLRENTWIYFCSPSGFFMTTTQYADRNFTLGFWKTLTNE